MEKLRIQYKDARLIWEFLAPIQYKIAIVLSVIVAVVSILAAQVYGAVALQQGGAIIVGISLTLLFLWKGVMQSMLNDLIESTSKEGRSFNLPSLVYELFDDMEKAVHFRRQWRWIPVVALILCAQFGGFNACFLMIISISIFGLVIHYYSPARLSILFFFLPLYACALSYLVKGLAWFAVISSSAIDLPPQFLAFLLYVPLVFAMWFLLRPSSNCFQPVYGKDDVILRKGLTDGLLSQIFEIKLIRAGAYGTKEAAEVYGGGSSSDTELPSSVGRGRSAARANLADQLSDEIE